MCEKCSRRFTTYERTEKYDFRIIKKDSSVEQYMSDKILLSLKNSCKGQNIEESKIYSVLSEIEKEILALNKEEINTIEISNIVLLHLLQISEIAFIRYASYQYEVHNIKDLLELKQKALSDIDLKE